MKNNKQKPLVYYGYIVLGLNTLFILQRSKFNTSIPRFLNIERIIGIINGY